MNQDPSNELVELTPEIEAEILKAQEECDECDLCGMPIFNNFDAYALTGLCGVCCYGSASAVFGDEDDD